ncbi:uncharacterized protein SCHCODRAFT_02619190 [Schizophyllum commune H4-8]|nr:uncharacterized protein SCHCODRAFT_02619190 [Schizophyllum commune H4-8]KAI5895354.1 hypothetical protein SCHCODRAFT_02619190 [Schizophyllum commune H4-8]
MTASPTDPAHPHTRPQTFTRHTPNTPGACPAPLILGAVYPSYRAGALDQNARNAVDLESADLNSTTRDQKAHNTLRSEPLAIVFGTLRGPYHAMPPSPPPLHSRRAPKCDAELPNVAAHLTNATPNAIHRATGAGASREAFPWDVCAPSTVPRGFSRPVWRERFSGARILLIRACAGAHGVAGAQATLRSR